MPTMLKAHALFSPDWPKASIRGSKQMDRSKLSKTVSFIDTPFEKSINREDQGSKIENRIEDRRSISILCLRSSILDLRSSIFDPLSSILDLPSLLPLRPRRRMHTLLKLIIRDVKRCVQPLQFLEIEERGERRRIVFGNVVVCAPIQSIQFDRGPALIESLRDLLHEQDIVHKNVGV